MSHTSIDQKRISAISVILVFFNFIPFFFSLLMVRYFSYFALLHLEILCDIAAGFCIRNLLAFFVSNTGFNRFSVASILIQADELTRVVTSCKFCPVYLYFISCSFIVCLTETFSLGKFLYISCIFILERRDCRKELD